MEYCREGFYSDHELLAGWNRPYAFPHTISVGANSFAQTSVMYRIVPLASWNQPYILQYSLYWQRQYVAIYFQDGWTCCTEWNLLCLGSGQGTRKLVGPNLFGHNTFEQAAEVFFDPFLRVLDARSKTQARATIIGMDCRWNLLFVVYIAFEDESFRLISARKSTRRERQLYEDWKTQKPA